MQKKGCKNSTKFDDNSLIVKCQNCQGCYHPHCVDMDQLEHWLGFMKSKKNREYWQYTSYYCLKHVQTMVRIKELAVLISDAVKSNHTAIDNKASKISAKVEILELGQNKVEKSIIGLSNKLTSLENKIDVIPKEHEKVIKGINEICINNAFSNSKFTQACERTVESGKKVDNIDSRTKKMISEDGWSLVEKKKKKNPPSFSTVLKMKDNETVDDLKKQMIQKYSPNEVNVSKVITAGKGKMIVISLWGNSTSDNFFLNFVFCNFLLF